VALAGRAQTTAAALPGGPDLERAEGRLDDAIFRYERVVAEFPPIDRWSRKRSISSR
jgi:hypothetical protein